MSRINLTHRKIRMNYGEYNLTADNLVNNIIGCRAYQQNEVLSLLCSKQIAVQVQSHCKLSCSMSF